MAYIIKYLSLPTKIVTFVSYMKKKVLTYAAAMMAAIMSARTNGATGYDAQAESDLKEASTIMSSEYGTRKTASLKYM